MTFLKDTTSRRFFLKTVCIFPTITNLVFTQTQVKKSSIPYVDGLCSNIFENPDDISTSGLSGIIADVSTGEMVTISDGNEVFRRTFRACLRSIVEARQHLRKLENVFLASDGGQIREAFKNGKTAIFLQIQGGGDAVGNDLSHIDLFRELGLRVLQVTHHHKNPLGGGALDKELSGLTQIGFEAVERMNTLGIIPDLSHASDQTTFDTLKTSKKPVIISHSAARALVPNARCSPDEVIRGIADSGGVMGIFMMSFWLTTDPVPTVDSLIKQIRHVIKVGGIDSVGISNDYPLAGEINLIKNNNDNSEAVKEYYPWWDSKAKLGILGFNKRPTHVAIPELNNIHRMYTIHHALETEGFKSIEIEKIMGDNWIRVLSEA